MWERLDPQRRERIVGAAALFMILNVLFFPFLWGRASIVSGARDVPSIYASGAAGNSPAIAQRMLLDDVGSGATVEPTVALEHHILFDERRFPLWNRDEAFGTPLAASMQEGTFCPFTFPMQLVPSATAEAWYVVARLFIAGFFAYLFFGLFVSAVAAFAGGMAFMLTGYFILFLTMPHLSIECLIPVALYFTERLIRRADFGTTAGLAMVMGLVGLGGFPESTLLVTLLAVAYFLARTVCDSYGGASRLRPTYAFAAALILGFGASTVLLVPFAEFAKVSITSHPASADVLPRGITDVDDNVGFFFGSYLVPLALGPLWHGTLSGGTDFNGVRGFWGILPFFFGSIAIVSLVSSELNRRQKIVAIFFTLVATLLIAKRFAAPEINWIGYLPVLRQVVFNKYDEPFIGFCVAGLCAFGMEIVTTRRLSLPTWLLASIASIAALSYWNYRIAAASPAFLTSNYFSFAFLVATSVLALTVLIAYFFVVRPSFEISSQFRCRAAYGLLVLLLVELSNNYYLPIWFGLNKQPNKETNPYAGAPYVSFLHSHVKPGERVFAESGFLWPNWQSAFDLPDIRANEAIYYARYLPFVQAFIPATPTCDAGFAFTGCQVKSIDDPSIARLLSLAGVRYVVTPRPLGDDYEKVFDLDASVYVRKATTSRAHLYHRVRAMPDAAAVLNQLTDLRVDVTSTAFVEDGAIEPEVRNLNVVTVPAPRDDRIEFIEDVSQRVVIETTSASDALLVLSDTNYPGWRALVDDKPQTIESANYLFRGVFVSAGHHRVEFRYEPSSYRSGAAISSVSTLAIFGLFLLQRRRRTRLARASATSMASVNINSA